MFTDISDCQYTTLDGKSVLLRLVEGIGYRFQRAMIGVNDSALNFAPAEGMFTIGQQVDHIGKLLETVLAVFQDRPPTYDDTTAEGVVRLLAELHDFIQETSMERLQQARTLEGRSVFFMINGPMADTLTHIGQINTLKRLAGVDAPNSGYMYGKEV